MRVIGTIRSTATDLITVDADTYAQVPEGHELIALRVDREDIAP